MVKSQTYISRQTSIRLEQEIYDKISAIANEEDKSINEVISDACKAYIYGPKVGLCKVCQTQNPPEAHYCLKCGQPLSCETVESLQHQLDELRSRFDESISMLKVAFKDKELIIGPDEGSKTLTAKVVDIQPESKDE